MENFMGWGEEQKLTRNLIYDLRDRAREEAAKGQGELAALLKSAANFLSRHNGRANDAEVNARCAEKDLAALRKELDGPQTFRWGTGGGTKEARVTSNLACACEVSERVADWIEHASELSDEDKAAMIAKIPAALEAALRDNFARIHSPSTYRYGTAQGLPKVTVLIAVAGEPRITALRREIAQLRSEIKALDGSEE